MQEINFTCFGKKVVFVNYKRDYDKLFFTKVLERYKNKPVFLTSEYAFLKDSIKNRTVEIITGCTPKWIINKEKPIIFYSGSFYYNWFKDCDCILVDMVSKEIKKCKFKKRKINHKFILFMNSKFVSLVFSLKSGQFYTNYKDVINDVKKFRKDFDIVIFKDDVIEESLINLRYDFYILTYCPRVIEKFSPDLKRISIHYIDFLAFKEFL